MASGSQQEIKLTVTHRGTLYSLSLLPETTLESLQVRLEELTSVPPHLQKLLYKGKNSKVSPADLTLAQAGFKDGMKVQMLGSTIQEVGGLQATDDEQKKRDKILRERALKAPTKVRRLQYFLLQITDSLQLRSTTSPSKASANYTFHQLTPLPHLPNPSSALSLLTRLANDPAIVHVMRKHQFSVGVLTELAPHEHPDLLGLNTNAGESIKLRLRTNAYDGFRTYKDVRRVLCHELSHNVWGDHDNNVSGFFYPQYHCKHSYPMTFSSRS